MHNPVQMLSVHPAFPVYQPVYLNIRLDTKHIMEVVFRFTSGTRASVRSP